MTFEIQSLVRQHRGSGFRLGPISLQLELGECLAVLGRNGSGKSTLFEAATGQSDIDEGTIRFRSSILTPDQFMLKRLMGYLPQNPRLPIWVTGMELLRYASQMHQLQDGEAKVEACLRLWDCLDFAYKPIGRCSYGMQKRLGLALATLHQPQLLILDEPFSGLDLYHIRTLEELIAQRTDSMTILSTHTMEHAALLCHRAIALKDGRASAFDAWPQQSKDQRLQSIDHFFF